METNSPNWVQYVSMVLSVVLIVGLFMTVNSIKDAIPEVPEIDIPTAAEIAALIVIPEVDIPEAKDTHYSVGDDKDDLAEELAIGYIDDDDFREDLADWLDNTCTETKDEVEDIDEDDITKIDVRDVDVTGFSLSKTRYVTFTAKVYFDNYGDDDENEAVRIDIKMRITHLDRDDDYEDAEVDEEFTNFEFIKCYNDFC